MLIYAHRGAHTTHPEHTLLAYEAGISEGADGFECDIRLTKDGEMICWHDSTTLRMTGKKHRISSSSYEELAFASPLKFEALLDLAIQNKKNLAVETKHPVPTGSAIEIELLKLLDRKQREISASGIWITIMSFSERAVRRLCKSPFESVFLIQHPLFLQSNPAPILGPGIHIVRKNPELVSQMHKQGKKVFVWTVNEAVDVRLCHELGVDVIMSDKPALAREALG
ncbi:MAG: glycerophosphodiester phosphodiesterase family protein [Actinomycetes bacterium]